MFADVRHTWSSIPAHADPSLRLRWQITSGQLALSAHVLVNDDAELGRTDAA